MAPWPGGATDCIKKESNDQEEDPLIRTPPYGPCCMQLYSYSASGRSWQFGARRAPTNNGTVACWEDALSGSVRVESCKHKKLWDKMERTHRGAGLHSCCPRVPRITPELYSEYPKSHNHHKNGYIQVKTYEAPQARPTWLGFRPQLTGCGTRSDTHLISRD